VSCSKKGKENWREPEELLAILLIQLRDDEFDGVLVTGDNNMLDGVDTTVGQLDHLIQDNERSLHLQ
jgi:hypothetical protein